MIDLKRAIFLSLLPLSFLLSSAHAQDVLVTGQLSTYPVLVQAQNLGCNGLTPVSFGYSVDNQTKLTLGSPTLIDMTDANIGIGTHMLHFKSWNKSGICPVLNLAINVVAGTGGTTPVSTGSTGSGTTGAGTTGTGSPTYAFPVNAVTSSLLNASSHWEWQHDGGTPGSSVGSTSYPVSSPSVDGDAREFNVSYSQRGGEIYHVSFATDLTATHFVYDTYLYMTNPSQVANIEMDVNHVTSGGRTVIEGTQCSSYSGTWEFVLTANGGPHWHASNIPCNPMTWSANTWHHVQIASHHDSNGVATYDWVNVDGVYSNFQNASGQASLALGWAHGDVLINFQLDGSSKNSGSMQVYTDKLQVVRW